MCYSLHKYKSRKVIKLKTDQSIGMRVLYFGNISRSLGILNICFKFQSKEVLGIVYILV